MIKTIIKWLKTMRFTNKEYLKYASLSIIESFCYLLIPVSFAFITTKASEQNFQLTYLWATTNFSAQIFSVVIGKIKKSLIDSLKQRAILRLNHNTKGLSDITASNLVDFIHPLNNSIAFILKLFAIIISASIFSIKLSLYIFLATATCFITSNIIQRFQMSKHKTKLTHNSIKSKNSTIDIIWMTFTFVITIYIITKTNNQQISLTAFLTLISFINTHLQKPNFSIGMKVNTTLIQNELDKYCSAINSSNV